MRKNSIWLAFLILGLVLAGNAWAQGLPTATLSGKVINEGQGLPGVSVAAKSPALQGTRTTVTSANGDYTFVSLPPGKYTITFSLTGFQPVVKQVELSGSQSTTVGANLSLSSVAAEATVVGRAENISEATQSSTTYTSEILNKLPVARTIISAVSLTPGLNQNGPNGAVSVAGGMSFDNLYMVNGANIMDNVRSTPTNLFIEDAIQETTTTTGGVSAEYGRFAGGVINTITKSGGNNFSGSLRVNFTNPAWAATPPKGADGLQSMNEAYEATFGGPIVKDAVWFFGAGRYAKTDLTVTTQAPASLGVTQTNKDTRYEGKLTISPLQNHTLTGSYLNYTVDQANYYFAPIPVYDLPSFYDRSLPSDFLVANYNGVLTSNFFVEGQYSQKHYTFENSGSRYTDLIKGSVIFDQTAGATWNSPVFCAVCPGSAEKRDNQDFFAKATYFLSTPSVGSHNLVAGYDQFRGHRLSNNWQSGSNFWAYVDDSRFVGSQPYMVATSGVAYLGYTPIFKVAQPSNMKTDSFFLNDAWKLNNNLSFNVGVRYDKNNAVDMGGATTQNDSAWSPRIGVTVDPKGDGKLRFNASYARYVAAVQETIAGGAAGGGNPSYFYYLYGGDDINTGNAPYLSANDSLTKFFGWWGINKADMFPTKNVDSLYSATYAGLNQGVASGMKSPHTDEITVGVAGSVTSQLTFRVDGTYRKGYDFLETATNKQLVYAPDGSALDYKVTQNGSDVYKRAYTGLAFQFAYKPTAALYLGGNWTWGHTYGNIVGESSGGGPSTGAVNLYPEYNQASWFAPVGELTVDQRHRVRLFAAYDLPLPKAAGNLNLSGIFQANSGSPYSAVGTVRVSTFVTNPGYATPPTNNSYYFSSRGAFTTEAWYQADLSLNYSHDIGPVQLYVSPQVLNVFNSQHIQNPIVAGNLNTTVYTANNSGHGLVRFNPFTTDHDKLIECPALDTAAQCAAMGANWQKGTSFGQAANSAAYQTPRTFRVAVGLRF